MKFSGSEALHEIEIGEVRCHAKDWMTRSKMDWQTNIHAAQINAY